MQDQAANLGGRGVACAVLSSSQPEAERQAVLRDLGGTGGTGMPSYRLVYVTPELLATDRSVLQWCTAPKGFSVLIRGGFGWTGGL